MLLLYGLILPFRTRRSAKAYQKIWDEETGSPLLHHSRNLTLGLQAELGDEHVVRLGMGCGKPSIPVACEALLNAPCDKIIIVPLFAQYASSTVGSCVEKALKHLSREVNIPPLEVIAPFYQHPAYIEALTTSIRDNLSSFGPCHLVLSYHGLPVRQVLRSEPKRVLCDQRQACPPIQEDNHYCYRAQCYATSNLLAKRLALPSSEMTIAFQSQMGRAPWIKPDLLSTLKELKEKGIKKIAIAMPSFVTDCLETLEEIGIRAKNTWQEMGGEEFLMIPCLNDQPIWVKALSGIVKNIS